MFIQARTVQVIWERNARGEMNLQHLLYIQFGLVVGFQLKKKKVCQFYEVLFCILLIFGYCASFLNKLHTVLVNKYAN